MRCDADPAGEDAATGLLVLSTNDPDAAALARLNAALDERGFRRGHRVGPVLAVTAPRGSLQVLADHVEAAGSPVRLPDADHDLLAALAPVERFAWDEGAETF